MKKEKGNGRKAGFRLGLISMLVIGILVSYMTFPHPILEQDEDTKSWHIIWEGNLPALAAEADPGTNTSGFLSVYFHPHQAVNMTSYMENSSSNLESNCTGADLGFANADDTEVDLKHSTAFDVVFRVQGNNSNCKVGGVWFDTNVKIQWTCADLSVGANTELLVGTSDGRWTANDTTYTYLYMNFWDDNGGNGFTISQDQTIEITSIKLLMYF